MSGTDVECDLKLLARYARDGSEDAFAEIVRRHLDVVHAVALRQVRSPQLAEEVAQSTFMKLATEARRLRPDSGGQTHSFALTNRAAGLRSERVEAESS
jgi:DNA-directed RNA polymerase specialized sigma24 family protein